MGEAWLFPLTLTVQGGLQKDQEIILCTWDDTAGLGMQVEGQLLPMRPLGRHRAPGGEGALQGIFLLSPGCQAPKAMIWAPADRCLLFSFT